MTALAYSRTGLTKVVLTFYFLRKTPEVHTQESNNYWCFCCGRFNMFTHRHVIADYLSLSRSSCSLVESLANWLGRYNRQSSTNFYARVNRFWDVVNENQKEQGPIPVHRGTPVTTSSPSEIVSSTRIFVFYWLLLIESKVDDSVEMGIMERSLACESS